MSPARRTQAVELIKKVVRAVGLVGVVFLLFVAWDFYPGRIPVAPGIGIPGYLRRRGQLAPRQQFDDLPRFRERAAFDQYDVILFD